MRVRPLQQSDIPIIKTMYENAGLLYDLPEIDGPRMEAVLVVENEHDGSPLMVCGAERIVQVYLWTQDFEPAAKLYAIHLLHEALPPLLLEKGYVEVDAFIPPEIEKSFGRRLLNNFGWTMNQWKSYNKRLKAKAATR